MTDNDSGVRGMRILIVGASSGVGRALSIAAHDAGARVALAARRVELLTELAAMLDGSAHQLDVADHEAIKRAVASAAEALGGLDAVVYTSGVVPLAHVEDIDASTWMHAFMVNALGASLVLRSALPHLSERPVILVASCQDVGDPRAGVAAYNASKAALDEMLRSWRGEHPELPIIRVSLGPTANTEILRGADQELLAQLYRSWAQRGQLPAQMSDVMNVANTLLALISVARLNPTVITEVVELAPRYHRQR